MKNKPFTIGHLSIQPGERVALALPTPELYTCAPTHIPIHIIHGKKQGPVLLVCAAIHGDEMNGISIIQNLLKLKWLKSLKGTLIAVPVVNIYGLITQSRYLPDRRDLDGSFPGSEAGSFAARLAHLFSQEILSRITHCIDLHTGEPHTSKFPQVHTSLGVSSAKELALAFNAPVVVDTPSSRGLLWLLHKPDPIPTIIYSTGEALRIDDNGIKEGVRGIIRVLRHLGMIKDTSKQSKHRSVSVHDSEWVRAPSSGLCRTYHHLGSHIKIGHRVAKIVDPFGNQHDREIPANFDGIIISRNNLPIVNEGEPILEIAKIKEEEIKQINLWQNTQSETTGESSFE